MSTVVILQSNYIPWRGTFDLIARADHFVFYDEVQFTKNDWRNRNIIVGKTGEQWLTIPIKTSGEFGQTIADTQVTSDRWVRKHWNALQSTYGKAPHFAEHRDAVKALYKEAANTRSISKINRIFITALAKMLSLDTHFHLSSDIPGEGDRNTRLVRICEALGASRYISGKAAQSYLDVDAFAAENIEVDWMSYPAYRSYRQADGEFRQGVSILDALFNLPVDEILTSEPL